MTSYGGDQCVSENVCEFRNNLSIVKTEDRVLLVQVT